MRLGASVQLDTTEIRSKGGFHGPSLARRERLPAMASGLDRRFRRLVQIPTLSTYHGGAFALHPAQSRCRVLYGPFLIERRGDLTGGPGRPQAGDDF